MASKRNKRRKIQAYIVKPFLICIGLFMAANFLLPTKDFSEEENRSLTKRPKVTVSGLSTGTFMEQYEEYQVDQFIGRNFLRSLKVKVDKIGGNKEENGVFQGKQGQLLEDIVVPDKETLNKNLEAIKTYDAQFPDVPTSMILVPDAANILSDKLPALATVANQEIQIKSVKRTLGDAISWIDASAVMKTHKKEFIYYKTDHHWTTLGAYYVFQESREALGIQTKTDSAFSPYPVTTSFNGTLAAKSGYEMGEKEQIDIYSQQGDDTSLVVNYVQEQNKRSSLYDSAKLKTRDKYAVFLGGNYGLLDITTTSNSTRRLILFKDSYANCYIPFLAPYFREIVVVDPRYYTGDATELMSTYHITDALFLYNANTFFVDNNLSGVLAGE